MKSEEKNLVIILGPTGVGKSQTAIKIAQTFQGEIINCDSMQVYKGFNIGTDKIPPEERKNIPHHLLDSSEASQQFTVADFVTLSLKEAVSILRRNRLPIITGGTGLYLKALIYGLFPEGKKKPEFRKKLEKEAHEYGLERLRKKLVQVDPHYAQKIGVNDKQRIIRALEVYYATGIPFSEHFRNTKSFVKNFNIIQIGLKLERQALYKRINDRVEQMFEKGMVKEVQNLLALGIEESSPPFRALGYKQVLRFLKNEITLEEAIRLTQRDTRHYAKRQMTWFKKMEGIQWFSPQDFPSIVKHIQTSLK